MSALDFLALTPVEYGEFFRALERITREGNPDGRHPWNDLASFDYLSGVEDPSWWTEAA